MPPTTISAGGSASTWARDKRNHLLYPLRQGTLSKLRGELSELRSNLEPLLCLLGVEISKDAADEVHVFREEFQAWRTEERNLKILRWVSLLDFDSRQKDLLARRHSGAGDWLFNKSEFQDWLKDGAQTPAGLWCYGRMGCGKSVLAAAVINYLEDLATRTPNIVVLYAYCDWQDSKAQNMDAMIGSLLKQCLSFCGSLPSPIETAYERHRSGKSPINASESLDLLRDAISSFDRAYIIIDGLDELAYELDNSSTHFRMASMEGALTTLLHQSSTASRSEIRVFATSRLQPQTESGPLWTCVEISTPSSYLKSYVLTSLAANDWNSPWTRKDLAVKVQADSAMLEHIADICTEQSNGTCVMFPPLEMTFRD